MIIKPIDLLPLCFDLSVHLPYLRLIFEEQRAEEVRRQHPQGERVLITCPSIFIKLLLFRYIVIFLVTFQFYRQLVHYDLERLRLFYVSLAVQTVVPAHTRRPNRD